MGIGFSKRSFGIGAIINNIQGNRMQWSFFSKLNYFIFGFFDPKIFFPLIKITVFWGDLSGISAKTATLIVCRGISPD